MTIEHCNKIDDNEVVSMKMSMKSSKKIWFATGNEHKREELSWILNELAPQFAIKIPSEAGIFFDPVEDGADFLENAFIKARALYKIVKEPVIADDSGLCVDALGGNPGVFSARYGSVDGKKLESAERNALLIREIGDNPVRIARFVCSMVLMIDENRFFAVQETLEGEIIREGRGRGDFGFGFDPILFLPEKNCTVAELAAHEKNKISHRGKAARSIAAFLESAILISA
jgi:XTP/dITP diphosphohydrolase